MALVSWTIPIWINSQWLRLVYPSHQCVVLWTLWKFNRDVIPVADNGFITKHKQKVTLWGWRRLVRYPDLSPVDSSECQVVSTGSRLKVSDSIKEHTAEWQQPSSITDMHDFLSILTVFTPIDSFYHPPASPVLSKSPLLVHSFIIEPPQIYFPWVPLHSIPPRPDGSGYNFFTFLLSSETFENGMGQDPNVAGNVSEDDKVQWRLE